MVDECLRPAQPSVAAPLNVHVKNWLHGENFKTVQDTQRDTHVGCRSTGPKRRHSVTQSRSQETDVLHGGCKKRSRRTSCFAVQFNRDGRRNCSPEENRQSSNKPFMRVGDSRRSSGQTRRRSASDGCCNGRLDT